MELLVNAFHTTCRGTPESEVQAALSGQLTGVLGGVDKERVLGVKGHVEKCNQLFDQALGYAKAAQEEKEAKDKAAGIGEGVAGCGGRGC